MKYRHKIQQLTASEFMLDDGTTWRIGPTACVSTWSVGDVVQVDQLGELARIWNVTRNERTTVNIVEHVVGKRML
jgi:hypothetical protein